MDHDEFKYTMLAVSHSDDIIYNCELPIRKAEVSFQKKSETLKPILDSEIFRELRLPDSKQLTWSSPPTPRPSSSDRNLGQYAVLNDTICHIYSPNEYWKRLVI